MYKKIVIKTTSKNLTSKTKNNIIDVIRSSKNNGPIEKSKNLSKKSTPFTPLSIIRLRPPVFREVWYLIESL